MTATNLHMCDAEPLLRLYRLKEEFDNKAKEKKNKEESIEDLWVIIHFRLVSCLLPSILYYRISIFDFYDCVVRYFK